MRIALVHVADQGGGAERSVLTLHQSLLERGHESRLLVAKKLTDGEHIQQIQRVRPIPGVLRLTHYLEQRFGLQNLYAPWFRSLDRQFGEIDVLHLHSLWNEREGFADFTGLQILSERFPTVLTLRDGWMLTGHCACPIGCDRWKTGCGQCPDLTRVPAIKTDTTRINWRRKQRALSRSPLHVTTVSHWLAGQVAESPLFTGKPVTVVHNSINENDFFPGCRKQAREALGIPQDLFVVMLAGQSIEWKAIGRSQHAVKALNDLKNPMVAALLVGNQSGEVAKSLTDCRSIIVPRQYEPAGMRMCYQAADVTVVTSEYETFGRVAAESVFCGTPVISFATGGLPEIVVPGISGWLVPGNDGESLRRTIGEVFEDQSGLQRMRSSCADWSKRQFALTPICDQYLRVYENTIAKHRQRN